MANCMTGTYSGATCNDDRYGLMYWNAEEQMYEIRTGYKATTGEDGKLNLSYDYVTGKKGSYDLPKTWFNDQYNALTGKFGANNTWRNLAIIAAAALILYFLIKKMT